MLLNKHKSEKQKHFGFHLQQGLEQVLLQAVLLQDEAAQLAGG